MRIVRVYPDYDTLRISRRKIPLSPSRGEFGMTSLFSMSGESVNPFQQLVPEYGQRFKERAFLPAAYRKRISELLARLRRKYGISCSDAHRSRMS
jgi:hypothetical protein